MTKIENGLKNSDNGGPGKYLGWAGVISLVSLSPFVGRFLLKLAFLSTASPVAQVERQKEEPQDKRTLVSCTGRYADICSEGKIPPGQTGSDLSKEESIQCYAWGLLLNESGPDINKQNTYLVKREKYFKRKLLEIEQGIVLEEEAVKLVAQAEKFDYQVRWFSEVGKRFNQMYEQYETQCLARKLDKSVSEPEVELEYNNKKQWLWR